MYTALFRHIERHITLSEQDRAYFQSLMKPRRLRKKQYLLQAGDVSRVDSYVVQGCLRAYEVDGQGREHILQFAVEDWWIGDMYSFLSGEPSQLNIDCLEDCTVVQISRTALEELYHKVPAFERYFRIMVQNAFIAGQQRMLSVLKETAKERYLAFLRKYPAIDQRVPDYQVASFLGITPQSLSRIRKSILQG